MAKKKGTKNHKRTEENAKWVLKMSLAGTPQETIGRVLKISVETLQKYYEKEIEEGSVKANANLAAKAYEKAMSGDTALLIFMNKTKNRWSERHEVEHSGQINAILEIVKK